MEKSNYKFKLKQETNTFIKNYYEWKTIIKTLAFEQLILKEK